MAAPGKRGAGWGSFLSQAVAGVEARLDNMLAENEDSPNKDPNKDPKSSSSSTPAAAPASPQKQSPAPSRTASTNRANDRLQERLARALAAKSAGQRPDGSSAKPAPSSQASPRQSSDLPSRVSTDSTDRSSQLLQEPISKRASQEVPRASEETPPQAVGAGASISNGENGSQENVYKGANGQRRSEEQVPPAVVLEENTAITPELSEATDNPESGGEATEAGDGDKAKELQKAMEEAQLQYQEEIHSYVERIDALESKLQFLARETTDSARKTALAAAAGSVERKLAEKDQQIAQLMEEGKNLASTEQKHRAIMKKLRLKLAEDEKELGTLKDSWDKTTGELELLRNRARQADELEKAHQDLQRRLDQSQKELGALRPEVSSKDAVIADLKAKLEAATDQADEMTAKANNKGREQDRRRIAELEESVAALQVEKDLVADRAKIQATELREKAERANERCRALELEMKAEAQVMESKLEAIRARAEEASSGATGDSQAKLLRQVETLQTQYSIASDNWQGIESTLLARIAGLEKERDEALRRESEMRKKAREAALRAKRNEEELEVANTRLPGFQDDVKAYQSQLEALKRRAERAEGALSESKTELEKQKNMWKAEKEERQDRADQERRGWLEDLPSASFRVNSRPESPLLTMSQRTFSSDLLGLEGLPTKVRKVSAPSSNSGIGSGDRPFSRRPSAQPPARPSIQGGITGHSTSPFSPTIDSLPTPSTHPMDRDDAFENAETPSSPHQVMQDMVSVSTVAAGPSVQLVERMSAAIRRLESEKVSAREELARISNQRDEARAEILALMREVESGKEATQRVAQLETEVAEINSRYETTLELLGEKSELVEELRADVQDVKAMYRDLVERTVK